MKKLDDDDDLCMMILAIQENAWGKRKVQNCYVLIIS